MSYSESYPVPVYSASSARSYLVLTALIGATFGYALSCVLGGPTSDEGFHAPQIWHYYSGGRDFADNLTVPPTYHFIMATIIRQIGHYSDYILRLINLSISLCALPIFYAIAQRHYPQDAGLRMLQLFFAPFMFPYFFLIYTDIWALLAVTLCLYCALEKRFIYAGLAGLLALSLRQDTVIWLGLIYLLISFEQISFKWPVLSKQLVRQALWHGLPFLGLFALFIAFVIYNGGVAVGDKNAHRIQQFNISNLYVFLICAWLLFLPLNIVHLKKVTAALRNPRNVILAIVGFLIYMGTFSNPHGYNNTMYSFFLHNGLLYIMMEYPLIRALLYIPMAWMTITLCSMGMPEKRFYWLLAIIPISTISHPLVEPRYYFPAYMMINLWRPSMPTHVEVGMLGGYVIAATFIMYGTVTGMFFL